MKTQKSDWNSCDLIGREIWRHTALLVLVNRRKFPQSWKLSFYSSHLFNFIQLIKKNLKWFSQVYKYPEKNRIRSHVETHISKKKSNISGRFHNYLNHF